MTPPGTFERVYAALKERLRRGTYKPGERLEPAQLSEELFASITPIRDALHRLTGERLVEAPRQEGFRVPSLSETRLRHLYAWHRDLLLLAMMRRRSMPSEQSDWETPGDIETTFATLARSAGNPELLLAFELVRERLEPLHSLEDLLLDEIEAESRAIMDALRSGDGRLLRKLLLAYHRRRERIVPMLLDCVQGP